jgi:hypothetical protein
MLRSWPRLSRVPLRLLLSSQTMTHQTRIKIKTTQTEIAMVATVMTMKMTIVETMVTTQFAQNHIDDEL